VSEPTTLGPSDESQNSGAVVTSQVEPFDTHRQIDCVRSWGNKDVFRCKGCGRTQTEIGVRLPDGKLDRPHVTGTLSTVVCSAWNGGAYAALAASQDDEDQAFHDAIRARRSNEGGES